MLIFTLNLTLETTKAK